MNETMTAAELRAIRARLGYSREVMAARLGVKPTTLCDLENNVHRFSVLIENAVRWVAQTGGPEIAMPCAACDGVGRTRSGPQRGAHRAWARCEVCDGQGIPTRADQVIA